MLRVLGAVVLVSFAAAAQQQRPPSRLEDVLPLPLPGPTLPPLDLSLLKDTSLCISPFLKETRGGASDKQYLESIQKTFFDVAKQSPLLKDAVMMGQSALCDPHDAACFSNYGKAAHCQNVLVGSSAAKGNGYVLSVRIFEVDSKKVMPNSEVEQVLETDRQGDVQAWAEGQACRALQVKCAGRLVVDADRKDMSIYVDNRLAPRTGTTPEQIAVEPGVHGVRVTVGQRTSLEKKVPVRRNTSSETVYARQTERGGLPLTLASDLKFGERPVGSVDVKEGKWTRPVGYTVAGVGLLAAAIGVYEGVHGKSLMNDANAKYNAQGGVYLQNDVSTIDSAKSATKTANILLIAGAVLAATGATMVFAF